MRRIDSAFNDLDPDTKAPTCSILKFVGKSIKIHKLKFS